MKKTTTIAAASLLTATIFATAATAQTVAFLMPDQASTRYEEHDWPGFQAAMGELCADCTLIYQNGNGDVALQQQQFNSVIAQGATVVVLDPVDSAAAAGLVEIAHSQDVKIIAYDRPIPDKPADFYVSFDNEGIGYAIAQSLVEHLQAEGVPEGAGVLQINGSPTDAAAGLIRDGIDRALDASPYKTLSEFDTPDWAPPKAQEWAAGQITRFGGDIKGIVAANDGTGGGAIAALKAAGADPACRRSLVTMRRLRPFSSSLQAISTIRFPNRRKSSLQLPPRLQSNCSMVRRRKRLRRFTTHRRNCSFRQSSLRKTSRRKSLMPGSRSADEVCTAEYADACASNSALSK